MSKPSNNIKKCLAYTLVLQGLIKRTDSVVDKDIHTVVQHTLNIASRRHPISELDKIHTEVKSAMDTKHPLGFIKDDIAIGLILNSFGNKLEGFYGLKEKDVIKYLDRVELTVKDVEIWLTFNSILDSAFNTRPYYSSLPVQSKQKKVKIKKPRDKPKKKVVLQKKQPKRILVTRNRIKTWCIANKLGYSFSLVKQTFEIGISNKIVKIMYDSNMTMKQFKRLVKEEI